MKKYLCVICFCTADLPFRLLTLKNTDTMSDLLFFAMYLCPNKYEKIHIICFCTEDLPFTHLTKVIYTKYSKHGPYTVAHTFECVCSKMLNHGLNHGFFLLLLKLISSPIHLVCIVCVLAYLNFIFEY